MNWVPSAHEITRYYAARLPSLRQRGPRWRGACPLHCGADPNFSVEAATGRWRCWSVCARGGSVFDLEMLLSNIDFRAARDAVSAIVGRAMPDAAHWTKAERRAWAEVHHRDK